MSDKRLINEDIYRDSEFTATVFRGPKRSLTSFYDQDEDGQVVHDMPGELTRAQCAGIAELLAKIKELRSTKAREDT